MADQQVYISICIPAYKRTDFLKRLLDSIAIQTYPFFEVIVADDSPGTEVRQLCSQYDGRFLIKYYKNSTTLGTPANWNEAICHATGDWIKIMHDDDWFSVPDALEKFAKVAQKNEEVMIFSSYYDVFLPAGNEKKVLPGAFRFRQLKKEPVTLLSRNIIGPPSVIMHRNDGQHSYDAKLKWLVDIDMYIRRLQDDKIIYLPESLIKIGVGGDQVTAFVHGTPEVEIPEHFYFLQKTGITRLRNVLVYDYWWRFFRNFSLFSKKDIQKSGYEGPVHPVMLSMMAWQKKLPMRLLKKGFFSKIIMFIHFCIYRKRLTE